MSDNERFYQPGKPRAKDRFIEISGVDKYGHPKAHVVLSYSERYSDGSNVELQTITVSRKPIVNIFSHAGYVNVRLDFRSRDDADLVMVWNLLEEYSRPINSISWLPDELETGMYQDENGDSHMVYFPMLELALSPLNQETEFMIIGMNPLFYTLQPNGPQGDACVIQFTFHESWFQVSENLGASIDLNKIHDEVMQEMAMDMMGIEQNDENFE